MNFQQVSFESAAGKASQLPASDLPEIVFSGKSNVGKSSLLNKLVNRKALARVSATPGKTAAWVWLCPGIPVGKKAVGRAGRRLFCPKQEYPSGHSAAGHAPCAYRG